MIVDRIYEYLDTRGKQLPPELVKYALARMERTLRRNLGEREERSRARNISGSLAWYCPRKAYFQLVGAQQEELTARARMAFFMGDVLQASMDVLATMAGVQFEYPDAAGDELELRDSIGGVEVVGHVDHAIRHPEHGLVVIDSKSMAQYGFDEFVRAAKDPAAEWWSRERWGYLAQIRFYMYLVKRLGLGDGKLGIFLGICKNTGALAQVQVAEDAETIAAFERAIPRLDAARKSFFSAREAVIATVVANGGNMQQAEAAASTVPYTEATGLLPRAPWAGLVEVNNVKLPDGSRGRALEVDTDSERTKGNGWRCNYCSFVTQCFPGVQLVAMSKPAYRMPAPK